MKPEGKANVAIRTIEAAPVVIAGAHPGRDAVGTGRIVIDVVLRDVMRGVQAALAVLPGIDHGECGELSEVRQAFDAMRLALGAGQRRQEDRNRSEERRVGKECRLRWWGEQ